MPSCNHSEMPGRLRFRRFHGAALAEAEVVVDHAFLDVAPEHAREGDERAGEADDEQKDGPEPRRAMAVYADQPPHDDADGSRGQRDPHQRLRIRPHHGQHHAPHAARRAPHRALLVGRVCLIVAQDPAPAEPAPSSISRRPRGLV